ncbi:MAG: TM2 domain-containing protein [Bacteroides sp.]|jgi:TM2 domain-containing membrane protein YozV|nr:TM2 domain-containing protein [Bacteroides sp.]
MKKLFLILVVFLGGIVAVQAEANMYRLDQAAVDNMFAQAEQVDYLNMNTLSPLNVSGDQGSTLYMSEKTPAVAFVLAWFLGPLGIHRAYLGTTTGVIIGYILTLGGCGIIAFVDWIVLLIGVIEDDISKYIDNPKFFMW